MRSFGDSAKMRAQVAFTRPTTVSAIGWPSIVSFESSVKDWK